MTPISAIVAGHICLDILPDLSHLTAPLALRPGALIEVGEASFCTGGPVSNTGLALHKLGIATRLMGKVGSDVFGKAVLDLMRSYGPELADHMAVAGDAATSYSLILSPGGADRTFLHNPGANHTFCAADVDYGLVSRSRLFHFGYPPLMRRMYQQDGAELVQMMKRVKEGGVTTSLDMCMVDPNSEAGRADWPKILANVLPDVDIFLPSIEELLWLLRRDVYQAMQQGGDVASQVTPALLRDLSDELLSLGMRIAAIKLGERGLYLRTADETTLAHMGAAAPSKISAWAGQELWAPCFQVEVAGTTGSGDATIAGFLAGLLRGLSPQQAVTMALAVGACNVEAADALSGLRTWEETSARVADGWPRLPLHLVDPAWNWDDAAALWRKK